MEIERSEDGRVQWCVAWVHGKIQGPAIQFDRRGRPLVVSRFVDGRGADIWLDRGHVTEYVALNEDGQRHGLDRRGLMTRPWLEEHYHHGLRHGVFREWSTENIGELKGGFPRFYVSDARVTKRAYIAACARDPSLPPYHPREDTPRRKMPEGVGEALDRARQLREELALVDIARGRDRS